MKKLLVFLFTFVIAIVAKGSVIYYVSEKGNDSNDGFSWGTAFATVQKAIDEAYKISTDGNSAQVWIGKGTFESDSYITMRNNVEIYGGFSGYESKLEQRNGKSETILTSKKYGVIYNSCREDKALNRSAKIDGVTISGGEGFGVYNSNANPTISNCLIANNNFYGIHNVNSSSPKIVNCEIRDNYYVGIYNSLASPEISNCTLCNNGNDGIYNYNSSPIIVNCTITDNAAVGLNNYTTEKNTNPFVANCTIVGNANGVYNSNASMPTIVNSIIWENSNSQISDFNSNPEVSHCVVEKGYSSGSNITSTDPLLGALSHNGGAVRTMAISNSSSAIGKGMCIDNYFVNENYVSVREDARGVERWGFPSIGAYESAVTTSARVVVDSATAFVGDSFSITIDANGNPSVYILYRNGVEIARQDSNKFNVPVDTAGAFSYSAGVLYNGSEIKSAAVSITHSNMTTFYVSTSGSDSNNGQSWAKAFKSVQVAVASAASVATETNPVQIWIAKGEYAVSALAMKNNVRIYGGFAGNETKLSARISSNKTIFSTTSNYVINNNYSANNRLNSSAKLDNVTITGAALHGIRNQYASPEISNCVISSNAGTGVYNYFYSSPEISNCVITNNKTGIQNHEYSNARIVNCTICNNTSSPKDDINGAGICNLSGSSPEIVNCTIVDNASHGVMSSSDTLARITNSILWGNASRQVYDRNTAKSTVEFCVVENGFAGVNIISEDPLLGELSDNGGLVQTMSLARESSAVGTAMIGKNIPDTDARGVLRGQSPSIGAWEYSIKTFYVRADGSDSNDGLSWNGAFATVQKAMQAASAVASENSIAQIWVANGTYTLNALSMKNNVEIYGGFAGSETTINNRNPQNKTIFSGTSARIISNVFSEASPLNNSAKIDNVTFTGASECAMYNNWASPTITNCTFSLNVGFAISNNNSKPLFSNCTISGNQKDGVENHSSSCPTFVNCTIVDNTLNGVCNYSASSPTFVNCTIANNASNGILNSVDACPIITNCIVWGNAKQQIYNRNNASPIVSYSVIEGGYSGESIKTDDPLLSELGNFGGFVQTMSVSGESCAIASALTADNVPSADARGVARTSTPTIGAWEYAHEVFYVNVNGSDSNNGKSWATPFASLQHAIDCAHNIATANPVQVWVAEGIYEVSSLKMKNYVEIYGGFAGTESKISERKTQNKSILSASNSAHVIYNNYTEEEPLRSSAKLDNFTVTGSTSSAISNVYAHPIITNCTISNNLGIAIHNSHSNAYFANCSITNNSGGFENYLYSNVTIENCTIAYNNYIITYDAEGNPTADINVKGSGISNLEGASPVITNCTIVGNSSNGIISSTGTSPVVTNCIVWGNLRSQIYNRNNGLASVSHSVVQDGISGDNIITADPLVGSLGYSGGFVDTMSLRAGSSAIAKGTSANAPTSDARGVKRAATPTIGAWEYSVSRPTYVSFSVPNNLFINNTSYIFTIDSDGAPTEYILYKGGVEIARSNKNEFEVYSNSSGTFEYSVGVVYGGSIIKSESLTIREYAPEVLFVKPDGSDENDGLSWNSALASLQNAINMAHYMSAGDGVPTRVWVGMGTYTLAEGTSLLMKDNVELYGGFAGTESNLDERVATNKTILTAAQTSTENEDGSITINTTIKPIIENNYRGGVALSSTAKIDNFTITGVIKGNDGNNPAAAISNKNASPVISNCAIINNAGSGIANSDSSNAQVVNCHIYNNGGEGGFENHASNPDIINCQIVQNKTVGISNFSAASPNIINCTIYNNGTHGISNSLNACPIIKNCIVWANKSSQIYKRNASANPTVSYCVVEGGYSGENIISADPLIGELGNYGAFVDVFSIEKGSSAIASGVSDVDIPRADIRGFARSGNPTIGAFEYSQTTPSFARLSTDENIAVGELYTFTVVSDGNPNEYILYRNGVEVARSGSNEISVRVESLGAFSYSVSALRDGVAVSSQEVSVNHVALETFYVSESGDDSNDGKAWGRSFKSVQKAIDSAMNVASEKLPARVFIAQGTYDVSSLKMANNVGIYGGFAGTESSLFEREVGGMSILKTNSDYAIYNVFSANTALDGSAKLDNVTITGATLRAINNSYASPEITNCTLLANEGTAIYNNSHSSPLILNCAIYDNLTGIENHTSCNAKIVNCTISNQRKSATSNVADVTGSAICSFSGAAPEIINCTITNNATHGIVSSVDTHSTLINCIVWANTSKQIYERSGGIVTTSYSVVQGGFSGDGIISADPLLGELSNYGGCVKTIALNKGSPAIAKGKGGENIPETDARGVARATSPSVGAFEYSNTSPTYAKLVASSDTYHEGDVCTFVVNSDGNPTEYILYRDGVEVACQTTNAFTLSSDIGGKFNYSVGLVYNGNILISDTIVVRQVITKIFYVSTTGNPENDGASWGTSLSDVQTAIDIAESIATEEILTQVWIAKGTYTSSTSYKMKNKVKIYGGFAGSETKLEERVYGNETVFASSSGAVIQNIYTAELPLSDSALLDNVTISGAISCGIYNSYANPIITNCKIVNCLNSTKTDGDGIRNMHSSPTILNCVIAGNYRGIANHYSSPRVINCSIYNNVGEGGVCSFSDSNSLIVNCTITKNTNGVLNSVGSSASVENCVIWGNTSRQIFNRNETASASVSDSVVQGGFSGGANILTTDPKIGELGNYGGLVEVLPVLSGSSAIKAGAISENTPTVDARGVARATPCTIGAFEFIYGASYEKWLLSTNLLGDNAKPESIPHSDNITNLEKFAFGMDANKATSYAECASFKLSNNGSVATFQYPVNKDAFDAVVKAYVSEDLVNWQETSAVKSGESGALNIYKVEKIVPVGGKLFFKVEVSQ